MNAPTALNPTHVPASVFTLGSALRWLGRDCPHASGRNKRTDMADHPVKSGFLRLIKNTPNRATIRIARSGRGPFTLVRHIGRKTGTTYETPIIVARVPDGFVAELTYGPEVRCTATSSRPEGA
jgi:hypothetical protein